MKKGFVRRVVYLSKENSRDPLASALTGVLNGAIEERRMARYCSGPQYNLRPASNGDKLVFAGGIVIRRNRDGTVLTTETYNEKEHGPLPFSDYEWDGYNWSKKKGVKKR